MPRYQPVSLELSNSSVRNSGATGVRDNHYGNTRDFHDEESFDAEPQCRGVSLRLGVSFWIIGLLNNAGYVIMIAAAKSISDGGVGMVFLANILPALAIKATAPYWFENVSYDRRLLVSTACMVASFSLVATASSSLSWQLLGVAFASAQGGLGEASLLALAGKIDGTAAEADVVKDDTVDNDTSAETSISTKKQKGSCLNGFSSGTGFAGVFGFFWIWFWNDWLDLSLQTTLWLATSLAVLYRFTYQYILTLQQQLQIVDHVIETMRIEQQQEEGTSDKEDQGYRDRIRVGGGLENKSSPNSMTNNIRTDLIETKEDETFPYGAHKSYHDDSSSSTNDDDDDNSSGRAGFVDEPRTVLKTVTPVADILPDTISNISGRQRFFLVLQLWPYMIPLFTVYVAEYTLQSGAWSSIGFPVTDKQSRNAFYEYSNWMYQAGVFCSRSSGALFVAPMGLLWAMPFLQVVNVGIYWAVAAHQGDSAAMTTAAFIYSPFFLYPAAFYTGLLGGAVYIHGYLRICRDVPLERREFALSATSLAESLGIVVADILGLVVQACLYKINGLDDSVLSCPMRD